jgi:two-component system NarL family response regulator
VTRPLSAFELDVLERISRGESNRDIGDALGRKPGFAGDATQRIYTKLGAKNRPHAVRLAFEQGILTPDEKDTTP